MLLLYNNSVCGNVFRNYHIEFPNTYLYKNDRIHKAFQFNIMVLFKHFSFICSTHTRANNS
jgi:hypothetical protein